MPIALVSLFPKGVGRRMRRCGFRVSVEEDFAVGERGLVDELWVCNNEGSWVIAAALATVSM